MSRPVIPWPAQGLVRAGLPLHAVLLAFLLLAAPAWAASVFTTLQTFNGWASSALESFRQIDTPLAETFRHNLDGDHIGLDHEGAPPRNFEPTRHLLYQLHDLNGDGQPDAILLFDWPELGPGPALHGAVMILNPNRESWSLGCLITDRGMAGGGLNLLPAGEGGWRGFETSEGRYEFRAPPDAPGAGTCQRTGPPALAGGKTHGWSRFPPRIAAALHALRQSGDSMVSLMAENYDGDRLGLRDEHGLRPTNFDSSLWLDYLEFDLNQDGLPEIFMVLQWQRGNAPTDAVILTQESADGPWHIACSFSDWGNRKPGYGPRILSTRRHGWREFQAGGEFYSWDAVPGTPRRAQCRRMGWISREMEIEVTRPFGPAPRMERLKPIKARRDRTPRQSRMAERPASPPR
ncbi:hypothetical protein NON00_20840 [Roseomonas sp. GC11]|uniref:hypothetical protein n=1 Tax=Roseomonas sp. GC11 TaxID=2950546 RepID=UPI00210E971E|nr:hypothetical protein [Roseomonas sp. GC11]MCQ4162363.1 hypothetical protein [Roseomonas sp. GC11]